MDRGRRAAALLIICGAAAGLSGCDLVRSLIVGGVVEPQLSGPFVDPPELSQITNATPDRVTTSASNVYFLWTHPDASDGVSYSCRVVVDQVEGVPSGTEVGHVSGASTANTIGGQIQFAMAPGTLLPGTYRAEISLGDQPFDSASFQVHGQ